jgi:outer membrane receptor protein involved in Fe transport
MAQELAVLLKERPHVLPGGGVRLDLAAVDADREQLTNLFQRRSYPSRVNISAAVPPWPARKSHPVTTVDITVVLPLGRAWALNGTVRNLFDVQYADPASGQHRQDVIPQNGRTARLGLRWSLGAR